MRTNKFAIGGLIGVHVNRIVNDTIRTISMQSFFFFFMEKLWAQKNTHKKKLTSENKIKQTENNKGDNLLHTKAFKRVKIICFAFGCFFYIQIFSLKERNCLEIVLIASFTILLLPFPANVCLLN